MQGQHRSQEKLKTQQKEVSTVKREGKGSQRKQKVSF